MKTGGDGEGRIGDGQKMGIYRLASVGKAWQSNNLPLAHARPSYSPYIPALKRRDRRARTHIPGGSRDGERHQETQGAASGAHITSDRI